MTNNPTSSPATAGPSNERKRIGVGIDMYVYQAERQWIFTDVGQREFLKVRDRVQRLLREAGAVSMNKAMEGSSAPDSWKTMALVDRLVELGELVELPQAECMGQHRVFIGRVR